MSGEAMFAVAVRDPDNLFLFLRVKRARSGVYILFPRDPDWDPHYSYHATGQFHYRTFGQRQSPVQRQPLGPHFRGAEHIMSTSIEQQGVRALAEPCNVERFSQVFEVPADKLGPTPADHRTSLSVDLVQPGSPPHEAIIGGRIVDQAIFDDAVPYIHITLWE